MAKQKIHAYFVPSTDPHQSEYVPACWRRRAWLSGFTGSAGDVVITAKMAGLWTDGRYFLQASQELRGSGIKLFKMGVQGVPTIAGWLSANLKKGQVLGADPQVLSLSVHDELEQAAARAGASLKLLETNLVDQIWGDDRPAPSDAPIEVLPSTITGETTANKLRRLRKEMASYGAQAHVLTSLDAIAWLFNIRSADVDHNPVAIANAIVTDRGATLFTDPRKVSRGVATKLSRTAKVEPYGKTGAALRKLARAKAQVWVDSETGNAWVLRKLRGAQIVRERSPIHGFKAVKNATEIAGMRQAHVRDGVAMVKFLYWLESAVRREDLTELDVANKLVELRSAGDRYRGTSFGTIAGYGEHGAIIHYEADQASAAPLRPEGILLVDSGAQYLDGTTDITRTVLLGGLPTEEQKEHFTRVLRGHIDLSMCRFPAGTAGKQLDTVARLPLWERGLNYNHGTGHGVGFYLNVHEGPQSLSPVRCKGDALVPGNILSNEPGYYAEGQYGIRIENLVLVLEDEEFSSDLQPFLRFETLTLCPIDLRLVHMLLLSVDERRWLNDYHQMVRETLENHLPPEERRWLYEATKKI
jgi:Xaa-Pro aminopeptidase